MDSSTSSIAIEIEDARNLFSRLKAGNHEGSGTAKAMSDKIRGILKDARQNVSVLSREGKSEREMEIELVTATIKLQVADSMEQFKKLKAGDIHVSPVFMADRIRGDLAELGQKLDKKMDDELTKHTVIQQLKMVREKFTNLQNGIIIISPQDMDKSIRKDLADIGKDLSALNTNPKVKISPEEMDKKLKSIVAEQSNKLEKLNEAKAIYEYIKGDNISANTRVKMDKIFAEMKLDESNVSAKELVPIINKKMEESGKPLSALTDGELSIKEVKAILDGIIMKELAKSRPSENNEKIPENGNLPKALSIPSLNLGFHPRR